MLALGFGPHPCILLAIHSDHQMQPAAGENEGTNKYKTDQTISFCMFARLVVQGDLGRVRINIRIDQEWFGSIRSQEIFFPFLQCPLASIFFLRMNPPNPRLLKIKYARSKTIEVDVDKSSHLTRRTIWRQKTDVFSFHSIGLRLCVLPGQYLGMPGWESTSRSSE